jgi:hypothetical protein
VKFKTSLTEILKLASFVFLNPIGILSHQILKHLLRIHYHQSQNKYLRESSLVDKASIARSTPSVASGTNAKTN